MAVKEQRPAVKRMKKGSSFFGYTDTSWKAGARKRIQDKKQHGVETTTTIIQLNWVGVFLRLHVAAAGVVLTGQ